MDYDVVGATYDVVGQHTILVPPTMYDLRRRRCDLRRRIQRRTYDSDSDIKQYRRYDVVYDVVGHTYNVVVTDLISKLRGYYLLLFHFGLYYTHYTLLFPIIVSIISIISFTYFGLLFSIISNSQFGLLFLLFQLYYVNYFYRYILYLLLLLKLYYFSYIY